MKTKFETRAAALGKPFQGTISTPEDAIRGLASSASDQPDLAGHSEVLEPLLTALAERARHARPKRQLVLARLSL